MPDGPDRAQSAPHESSDALEMVLRYRAFFEQGPDSVVVLDPATGRVIEFNDQACRQLGYTREEFAALSVVDIDAVETPAQTEARISQVLRDGRADFETLHRTRHGELRDVHVTAQVIDVAGRRIYHCIWRDITARKRAEEALEKRLAALTRPESADPSVGFEDLFDVAAIQRLQDEFARATGVASIITRPDGTPITAPSAFCRLCRDIIRQTPAGLSNCYRSDAELGRANPAGPTVQPCMSGGLWDAGAGITSGGHHIANWLIGQVRDETQTEATMREYAVTIGADEEAFIEAFRDVPAMSRGQFGHVAQVLFTLANQLSSMAYQNVRQARFISELRRAEREQRALQDRLAQAEKMESIGRLAGGVAHDFNNMLGVIIGHVELARESIAPESPVYADLTEIGHAAERSADLVRQLLAFARKQTVSPRVLDLNECVDGMLGILRRLIGENIRLDWLPGGELRHVNIDPSQVSQILTNLCVNARDSIAGVGEIRIATSNADVDGATSARYGASPGRFVRLEIGDTGCGMSAEVLSHLFEPFFTTKGVGRGTGLGLATVYGIVSQNRGFVEVESRPGRGTTFRIHLPAHSEGRPAEAAADPAAAATRVGRETVLLVEDEAAILRLGQTMLKRMGYVVLAAARPADALDLASRHQGPIDLLITDVVMPDMNGRELAARLLPSHPKMRRLYMSGYTADVIAHHGVLEEGMQFIQKPFSVKQLASKVREALSS